MHMNLSMSVSEDPTSIEGFRGDISVQCGQTLRQRCHLAQLGSEDSRDSNYFVPGDRSYIPDCCVSSASYESELSVPS